MKKITLRKIVSLIALWSFIFISWTGITLYFVPPGRIAYWVTWEFAGLTKTQYGEIHQTFSILFLITMFLHIWLNWKSIMLYLKNKTKKFVFFTKEMTIATIISFIFLFGTLYNWIPFSNFFNLLDKVDEHYEETYGNPPISHGELLSLENICKKMNLDLEKSVKKLNQVGIKVNNSKKSLADIAKENNTNPAIIYNYIKDLKKESKDSEINNEEMEITGLGRKKVSDVAKLAKVNIDKALERLNNAGFNAAPDSKMIDLATSKGMLPMDLYNIIKDKK